MGDGIVYFRLKQAMDQYDTVMRISDGGGLKGVLHIHLLDSALEFIQNDEYYPEFRHKLTHLVFTVSNTHCFTDGNKRTSIALGAYFLTINGYEHLVPRFIVEMENVVLWVAANLVPKELLLAIITDIVELGELSEETQLELVDMLERYERMIESSGLNNPNES